MTPRRLAQDLALLAVGSAYALAMVAAVTFIREFLP